MGGHGPGHGRQDGRWYLDFYGGHAVATLGYRHPRLVEAVAEQAHALFFQTNLASVPVRRAAADGPRLTSANAQKGGFDVVL